MANNDSSSTLCCDKCGLWLDGLGNDHEAREHIDRLFAELTALRAERDRYRAALEWMAFNNPYGERARAALDGSDDE